ncbi:MAG TPA: hypothetical protein VHG72_04300 [Polyangia bacterium]|nr:hypothetical protein [Polyangia bacterium]
MNAKDDGTALCAQVFDRLIEAGGDLGGDRHLSEHLGSCVTCFRTLTDLRDAPRVAEALRADPAPVPRPDDRFWEDLAQRTVAATEAAMRVPAAPAPRRAVPARPRWWRGSLGSRAGVSSLTAALAAAAAWVIVARHAPVVPPVTGARPVAAEKSTGSPTAYAPGEDGTDETADVADLDTGALRRLLDQVRAHVPAALASGGESSDNGEVVDDETRVNDEVADLDRDELRRVASSLEGERL